MIFNDNKYNTILLSYPRCGSNWLSYIIENISDITIGGSNYSSENTPTTYNGTKSHGNTYSFVSQLDKLNDDNHLLIVIVRNYLECIPSHTEKYNNSIIGQMSCKTITEDYSDTDYLNILKFYDECVGNKILVYYEDLINNHEKEVSRISEELKSYGFKIKDDSLNDIIKNKTKHKDESIRLYDKFVRKPLTNGNNLTYHVNKLGGDVIDSVEQHLTTNFNYLNEKYLKRYDR